MAGNSESYTKRLEDMRANLAVDRRQLEEMNKDPWRKLDLFRRDRPTLERQIASQERRIRIAESY